MEKLNNQELSAIKDGRKEDEGGVSFIGIGGIDDDVPHNAYLCIFTFKNRLPWW